MSGHAIGTALHLYQCWNCRATLTVTVKAGGAAYRCVNCHPTPMKFLFSRPIETAEDRALAERCPVYNAHDLDKPKKDIAARPRPCQTCRAMTPVDKLLHTARGHYCSEDCAQTAALRHQEFLERVEKVYQEQPWLRPAAQKETA